MCTLKPNMAPLLAHLLHNSTIPSEKMRKTKQKRRFNVAKSSELCPLTSRRTTKQSNPKLITWISLVNYAQTLHSLTGHSLCHESTGICIERTLQNNFALKTQNPRGRVRTKRRLTSNWCHTALAGPLVAAARTTRWVARPCHRPGGWLKGRHLLRASAARRADFNNFLKILAFIRKLREKFLNSFRVCLNVVVIFWKLEI